MHAVAQLLLIYGAGHQGYGAVKVLDIIESEITLFPKLTPTSVCACAIYFDAH